MREALRLDENCGLRVRGGAGGVGVVARARGWAGRHGVGVTPPAALRVLPLVVLGALLGGCDGVTYVLHVAQGQLQSVGAAEPIDDVLASGRLSAEQEAKLRLAVAAREFAVETIGLNAGESYTAFLDTSDSPPAFNLSAARRDALRALTWTFPIIGEVPYLAFFDEAYLNESESRLIAEGYDTLSYELDAYSTLGVFEDPIRSSMLERSELSLSETIIHELLHNTIWRSGEAVFNESLATYVGRTAAAEFLVAEYGADSGWGEIADAYYSDLDATNAFLLELYEELESYYAGPASTEEKIAGREAVYQAARDRFRNEIQPSLNYPDAFAGYGDLPTNNAWMRLNYRYHLDLDMFDDVFKASTKDWSTALAVYRAAAEAPEDPFEYLRQWLQEHK